MKKVLSLILALAMVFALVACGEKQPASDGDASSDGDKQPARGNVIMTFGTADTGGSMYPAGAAVSQVWTNNVQGVKCNTQTSTGSFQNCQDVSTGEVDVAVATSDVVLNAYNGTGKFADIGALCLVENEGNIGLSTTCPKLHVALIGIEKIIPKAKYLPLFLNMLPRMGTGQKLTSYTHLFTAPTDGRDMRVIIVDNGRTNALASPETRGVLRCIRCGVCMTHCPVYRQVGGWAYGWVYPGPLGAVLTPQLLGMQKAGKLPFACSLCAACSQICPANTDSSPTGEYFLKITPPSLSV